VFPSWGFLSFSQVQEMATEIPVEHRKEWYRITSKDPEMLLKLTAEYK